MNYTEEMSPAAPAACFHWPHSFSFYLKLYTRWKMWRCLCLWAQLCGSRATVFIPGDGPRRVTRGDNPKHGCSQWKFFHCYLSESIGKWTEQREREREKVVSISCLCPWCVSNCHSLKPCLTGASLSFPVLWFSSSEVGGGILLLLCPAFHCYTSIISFSWQKPYEAKSDI